MKKISIVFIIVFIILISSCESKKNNYLASKIIIPNSFINEISKYSSFKKEELHNYYRYYLDNYSFIESLNKVNHPNFLYNSNVKKAITVKDTILVNKTHFLDKDYIPPNLVKVENVNYIKRPNEEMLLNKEALKQYKNMEIFAKQNNLSIYLFSCFRSYSKQQILWEMNSFITSDYLALPGFSEHQTGLSVDIASLKTGLTSDFENTLEFKFLMNNAHKYGFILRYPKDKKDITGYGYEPWHFRYVGKEIAKICYKENLTLEEYFYKYFEIPNAS